MALIGSRLKSGLLDVSKATFLTPLYLFEFRWIHLLKRDHTGVIVIDV